MNFSKNNLALPIILLVAATVRIWYLIALAQTPYFSEPLLDAQYYLDWARQLSMGAGGGFQGNPLYPWMIQFPLRVWYLINPDWSVRIIQLLLGLGTTTSIFFIGKRLLGTGGAILAGLTYALYPEARFYEGWFLTASWETFLSVTLVAVLLAGEKKLRFQEILGAGLLAGIGFLVRPTLLPLGAAIWLALIKSPKRWIRPAIFIGGIILILAVAGIIGIPGPLPSHGGENLYIGNNPDANGTGKIPAFARPHPKFQHGDFLREASLKTSRKLTETEASRFWIRESLSWILHNPGTWIKLFGTKIFLIFSQAQFPDNYHPVFFARYLPLLGITRAWQILAALSITGMILVRKKRNFSLLYISLASLAIGIGIFFVTSRFRQPLVPFLCLFAAAALKSCWDSWHQSRTGYLAGIIITTLVAFFILEIPGRGLSPQSYALTASEILYRSGDYPGAEKLLKEAETAPELQRETVIPRFKQRLALARGKTLYALGQIAEANTAFSLFLQNSQPGGDLALKLMEIGNCYAANQNFERARDYFKQAHQQDPKYAPALNNLGLTLKQLGQVQKAEELFKQAISLDPEYASPRANLGNIELERGNYIAAAKDYRAALKINPTLVKIRYALAHTLAQMGERDQARIEIEKLPPELRRRIKKQGY